MNEPKRFAVHEFVRGAGEHVAFVRLPTPINSETIIVWGAHHFKWDALHRNYIQCGCYMVPLEDMYITQAPAPAPGAPGAKP